MSVFRADQTEEIAAVAARFVVEEGLEYAAAKRRAVRQLGLSSRAPWPDSAAMDAAVRDYIDLFCADTQPTELMALRKLALVWMDRLAEFCPLLGGAVWHGTATRHSDIYIQLYCDDPKAAELTLLNHGVEYHPGSVNAWKAEPVDALTVRCRCVELGQWALVHLLVQDRNDVRGALKPDAQGRRPRGDANGLRALMSASVEQGQTE